jgi:hypothetical protein
MTAHERPGAGGSGPTAPAPARWRLALSVALVAVLAAALLAALWSSARPGGDQHPAPTTAAPGGPAPATSRPPGSTAGKAATTTPTTTSHDHAALLEAARAALQAWGRFAGSGDLGLVRPYFWANGPQYQQFQQEAPTLRAAPGRPYSYALRAPVVQAAGRQPVVRGSVVISRLGEQSKTVRWDLHLRRDPTGRWRVWTVTAAPADG